jgi:hypothetical protein
VDVGGAGIESVHEDAVGDTDSNRHIFSAHLTDGSLLPKDKSESFGCAVVCLRLIEKCHGSVSERPG